MPWAELDPKLQAEHGEEADTESTLSPLCHGSGFGDLDRPTASSSFQRQGDGTRLHAEQPRVPLIAPGNFKCKHLLRKGIALWWEDNMERTKVTGEHF